MGKKEFTGEVSADPVGLTTAEIEKLQEEFGFNEVIPHMVPEWTKIAKRYFGLVPIIMMVTAVLGGVIEDNIEKTRDWISFGLLLFELNLVVFVDYIGDRNAGNAIKALQDLNAPKCRVLRNGAWITDDVRTLVPGDICAVMGGSILPADGMLVGKGEPMLIDESSLTGESLAVTKRPGNDVLAGSICKQGELDMVVVSTGEDTFFGKAVVLLSNVREAGHLQKVLAKVAKTLAGIGSIFCTILFIVRVTRDGENPGNAIKLSFVILTAIVPIAMPVVTTTVLAVGARSLARNNAVVTRLSAIEEMAGMSILCSDKTGTLTKNVLELNKNEIEAEGSYSNEDVLKFASLGSKLENQEAIDKAVTEAYNNNAHLKEWTVKKFLPFNPVDKRTVAHCRRPTGGHVLISKGAPHIVREMVAVNDEALGKKCDHVIANRAERGLRTLGVAIAECGETWDGEEPMWQLVGMISLFDPPRDDTKDTIERAQTFGVQVKMVTGDQQAIAIETARQLGMGTNILGNEVFFNPDLLNGRTLGEMATEVNGFAGVFPEHKFQIVKDLQATGELIGMTGDGVNDAPALKKANVGVAVHGATDAAKGAADIVLLSPGLSTIITALELSRQIFARLNAYVMYRMASSTLILFFFFVAIVAFRFEMPTWILILLSLVNDFTIMSCSKDHVLTAKDPLHWNMIQVLAIALTIGFTCVCSSVLLLFLISADCDANGVAFVEGQQFCGGNWWPSFDLASTSPEQNIACIYLNMAISIQMNIFATRTKSYFWHFNKVYAHPPSWPVLVAVAFALVIGTVMALVWDADWKLGGGSRMSSVSGGHVGIIWAYTVLWFVVADFMKVLTYKVFFSERSMGALFFGSSVDQEGNVGNKDDLAKLRQQKVEADISKAGGLAAYVEHKHEDIIASSAAVAGGGSAGAQVPHTASGNIGRVGSRNLAAAAALGQRPAQASGGGGGVVDESRLVSLENNLKGLMTKVDSLLAWRDTLEGPTPGEK